MVSDRRPAQGDDDVRGLRLLQRARDGVGIVGRDAAIHRLGAGRARDGGDAVGVGGDDLVRPRFAAGSHKFVAVGDKRHPRATAHGQLDVVHRRRQGDRAGIEQPVGEEKALALTEVQADGAHEATRALGAVEPDPVGQDGGVLLDRHRVGAARQRRTGEDAHAGSGLDHAVETASGGRFADHAQRSGQVGRAYRVAIHRRGGEGRLGAHGP